MVLPRIGIELAANGNARLRRLIAIIVLVVEGSHEALIVRWEQCPCQGRWTFRMAVVRST